MITARKDAIPKPPEENPEWTLRSKVAAGVIGFVVLGTFGWGVVESLSGIS